uniref:Uncharacterized protein n=1 Tax=viral metagenome TaxID=1070528 RepID=A0A6C0JT53_9ZZZZ
MSDGLNDSWIDIRKINFEKKLKIIESKKKKVVVKFLIELQDSVSKFQKSNPTLTKKQWELLGDIEKNLNKIFKEPKIVVGEDQID